MLNLIDRLIGAMALFVGGAALLLLLALTVIDVSGRYAFDWPVYGSLDLYGVLLATVVAVSIGYGGRTGAHVSADVFAQLAGPRTEHAIVVAVRFMSAVTIAVWAWQLFAAGNIAARLDESTQLLGIPFQPVYQVLGAGIGLYAVVLFVESWLVLTQGKVPLLVDDSLSTMESPE